jgi:hypothetical protein
MKPIFYVFQPETHYMRYQHSTLESATKEAERLARLHPGRRFQVLAVIKQATSDEFTWDYADGIQIENGTPDVPF